MTSVAPRKRERTQARVLDAAVRRFGSAGFRATSVASVARDAGLTPAAVFAYWPSKEALFTSAVDADARAVVDELLDALPDEDTAVETLAPVVVLYAILERHPLARRVLGGQEPEVIDRVLELDAFRVLRSRLAARLERAQAEGAIRSDLDAALAATGLEALTLAFVMALLQLQGPPDQARVDGVTELLRAAFAPSSTSSPPSPRTPPAASAASDPPPRRARR